MLIFFVEFLEWFFSVVLWRMGRCGILFGSKWKLKEYLLLVFYSVLWVIYFFCCEKENSFNMVGDLKFYVEEYYKDVVLVKKYVFKDELVWLLYNFVVYRNLMELIDRNVIVFFWLGFFLFGWIRKILVILVIFVGLKVKRGWYDLIEGWDRFVNDFRVFFIMIIKLMLIFYVYLFWVFLF